MADDWIKVRTALQTDPRVDQIGRFLLGQRQSEGPGGGLGGADPLELLAAESWPSFRCLVVGALISAWTRAGEVTSNGDVPHLSRSCLDVAVGVGGLESAMHEIGWLEYTENETIRFPKWDHHNSSSAKKRALEARKKRLQRSRTTGDKCPPNSGTSAGPEKRREEKKNPTGGKGAARKTAKGPHQELIAFWTDLWLQVRGEPYAFEGGKDGAAVKRCLKYADGDVELVRARMRRLLEDPPDAWMATNASLSILASKWNPLGAQPAPNGNGKSWAAAREDEPTEYRTPDFSDLYEPKR